ncbi:MAG: hypothetical protein LUJ25_07795, partial [Firmicutes bacterium]|nr:hypothetical protein [Bacillota bacterium]
MFHYVPDHVVVDQTFLPLEGVHQRFFANPVDYPWDTGGGFEDLINSFFSEDILTASGVIQVTLDILPSFRSVQMGECTI